MQVKFLLALLTSLFSKVPALYLAVNCLLSFGLVLLILTLKNPNKPHENPAEERRLQLIRAKVKIGRLASYLSVWLGSIFAIPTYALNNETASNVLFVILVILQVSIAVVAFISMRIAEHRHKQGLGFLFFFKAVEMPLPLTEEDLKEDEEKPKDAKDELTRSSQQPSFFKDE